MKRGLTLLEVLFSIAIVAIGFLGVLSLIVVAGHRAARGARLDAADRVGRNAVQEVRVRGLYQPSRWTAQTVTDGRAYAVDHLHLLAHTLRGPAQWLPAIPPADAPGPRIHRTGLRSAESGQPVDPLVADRIFRARDDLLFDRPTDPLLAAVGRFDAGVRVYEGQFTWFPIVQADAYNGGSGMLWIVVCHRRDVLAKDRLLVMREVNGSEIEVAPRDGMPETDLDISDNQWLLLAGRHLDRDHFAWRRANSVSSVIDGTRFISTVGRDWDAPAADSYVAVIDGVVAVYEKTIRFRED
jgi:prepilin-type N-terminal cleavage/methylation domain-containing protein